MEFEILGLEHHAWIRRPPQDGLPLAEPWEDALTICLLQATHTEPSAGSNQSGELGVFRSGALWWGEMALVVNP
jgi:hypothetical protein